MAGTNTSERRHHSDGEPGRRSDGEPGRRSDGEPGRRSDGEPGRRSDGEPGRRSDGERRRRSDGERSRRAILDTAARLATVEGIDGLSIGRLAQAIGMSKSGLYAHFGSKEELQLATVAAAQEVFDADVIEPALRAADGLARVEALCERFLSHVERRVFPGGCFFSSVAAELDTRPGPVRDRIAAVQTGWTELMASSLRAGQKQGELDARVRVEQLTFELNAFLAQANTVFLLQDDRRAFDLARRGIGDRLERARAAPAPA